MTSHASFSAAFIIAACDEYFERIADRVTTNIGSVIHEYTHQRKWFGLGRFYTREEVLARVTGGKKFGLGDHIRLSVEFAQSSEYYGNTRIRNLRALAQTAEAQSTCVQVEAEDAHLLWPSNRPEDALAREYFNLTDEV